MYSTIKKEPHEKNTNGIEKMASVSLEDQENKKSNGCC